MFKILKELNEMVNIANKIAVENGPTSGIDAGDWIVFFKTRSFVALGISIVFMILPMIGIYIPFGETATLELYMNMVAVIGFIWALIERLLGKKKVVWNKTHASKAINQATAQYKVSLSDKENAGFGTGGLY